MAVAETLCERSRDSTTVHPSPLFLSSRTVAQEESTAKARTQPSVITGSSLPGPFVSPVQEDTL